MLILTIQVRGSILILKSSIEDTPLVWWKQATISDLEVHVHLIKFILYVIKRTISGTEANKPPTIYGCNASGDRAALFFLYAMFLLAKVEDTVKIEPGNFGKSDNDAITEVLNTKFANKIVPDVGLCICVHDILETVPGIILHLDGCSYMKAKFRLVIFRPYVGEVLTGRIASCSPAGVRVTMGFFDDIHIPAPALQPGSEFDPAEQVWVWNYEGEKMYMDIEEPIRFRVLREVFTDKTPTADMAATTGRRQSAADTQAANDLRANSVKIPPYALTCTISEDGLGLLSWWGS